MAPQADSHLVGQLSDSGVELRPSHQIAGKGESVAHRFGAGLLPGGHHGGMLRPSSVVVEGAALPAQDGGSGFPVEAGQIPDGVHAVVLQRGGGRPPHKEQGGDGQGPEQLLVVLPGDHRGGVRLFVVAAHLGEDLVEGYPHRYRQAQFLPQHPADLVGQGLGVSAEEVEGAGYIQPALVDGEGLHQVGVPLVHRVDPPGVVPVLPVVGGEEHQLRALAPGLPDGLGGLHLVPLGGLVLGQDDPVAGIWIAAHRHRSVPELRVVQQFHRGVKAVQITVQNHPVHTVRLLAAPL